MMPFKCIIAEKSRHSCEVHQEIVGACPQKDCRGSAGFRKVRSASGRRHRGRGWLQANEQIVVFGVWGIYLIGIIILALVKPSELFKSRRIETRRRKGGP